MNKNTWMKILNFCIATVIAISAIVIYLAAIANLTYTLTHGQFGEDESLFLAVVIGIVLYDLIKNACKKILHLIFKDKEFKDDTEPEPRPIEMDW